MSCASLEARDGTTRGPREPRVADPFGSIALQSDRVTSAHAEKT